MNNTRFERQERESTGIAIQAVADTVFVLGVLASLIGAVVLGAEVHWLVAILIGAVGCYLSWALSRVLRGLGEMVEDTAATRNINEEILAVLREQRGVAPETGAEDAPQGFSIPQWEDGAASAGE